MRLMYQDAPPPPPSPPPTPSPLPYMSGGTGDFLHGGGITFATSEPFTVEQYALFRGCSVAEAQATLDQAVIDGKVDVV